MNRAHEQLPDKLRALRESSGFSVRELAHRVGVSSVTIWKWENGSCKPSARSLFSLAKALDIPPVQLEFMTKIPKKKEETDVVPENDDHLLPDVIARAKQMIADAAGANPDNVKIVIEY